MKDVTPIKSRDELIQERLYQNPDAMEHIFNHVSQGGTLTELAKMWEVPYWAMAAYTSKEGRDSILQRAMVLRSEYWIEKLKGLIQELTESNISDFFNEDGTLKKTTEMPRHLTANIQSLEIVEYFEGSGREKMQVGFTNKIKFWDKTKAIEMLAKINGMFVDRHEHKHQHVVKLEDLVAGSQDVTPIETHVDKSDSPKEI